MDKVNKSEENKTRKSGYEVKNFEKLPDGWEMFDKAIIYEGRGENSKLNAQSFVLNELGYTFVLRGQLYHVLVGNESVEQLGQDPNFIKLYVPYLNQREYVNVGNFYLRNKDKVNEWIRNERKY